MDFKGKVVLIIAAASIQDDDRGRDLLLDAIDLLGLPTRVIVVGGASTSRMIKRWADERGLVCRNYPHDFYGVERRTVLGQVEAVIYLELIPEDQPSQTMERFYNEGKPITLHLANYGFISVGK